MQRVSEIFRSALQTSDAQLSLPFLNLHLHMHADVAGPGPRLDVLMLVILFIGGTKYFTRILTLRRGNKQFTDISGRILSSPHSDLLAGLELSTKIWDSEKVLC